MRPLGPFPAVISGSVPDPGPQPLACSSLPTCCIHAHTQHTATHAHTDTHLHVFTLTHNIHLHNTFIRSHILTQHTPTQHSYMLTHTTPSHNTQIHTHTQTFSALFKTSPDRCLGQFLTPQTWFRRSMAVTGDRTGTGAGVWREAVPPPPAGAGVGDPGPQLSADI